MRRKPGELEAHVRRWQASSPGRPAGAVAPGPGQESVWDYPRPPRLEPCARSLRVEHGGRIVARTARGLRMLERASPPTYYFPPDDVDTALLERSSTVTHCEWKGDTIHWSLRLGDRLVPDVAWTYPDPYEEFASMSGYFAFYPARVDGCFVDDERARPQAGGFYGGWVTSAVVGPFKGDPGTSGW